MSDPAPIHATLVARFSKGAWLGVLLRGPSGVGKSDLALKLVMQGWRLVADDRVLVWRSGGRLWGRAPETLRHLLEVRGVGVLSVPALDFAQIHVVVDCQKPADDIERVPEPAATVLCGAPLPRWRLHPLEASALAKVTALCGVLGV